MISLLLSLLIVGTAAAADLALLGDVDEDSLARVSEAIGRGGEAVVVSLPAAEGAWYVAGATFRPVPPSTEPLGAAIAGARALLDDFEAAAAAARISDAVVTAPNGPAVDRAEYLAALDLWGEAAQEAGDETSARSAYLLLLAADPAYELTAPPGMGYEDLWNAVRRDMNEAELVAASIQHAAASVWWDGQPVAAQDVPRSVRPGRHLLQWLEGEDATGAWVDVKEPLALVWAADAAAVLARGPVDAGAQAALAPWLGSLRAGFGVTAVAVAQSNKPPRGYLVDDDGITAWAGGPEAIARSMKPDRVRVAVGGGYAATVESFDDEAGEGQTLASSFGGVGLAVDIKAIAFVHARVRGDLQISEPARLGGDEDLEVVALLPGVTAGVLVHPERGVIQPWASVAGGLWFAPPSQSAAQRAAAADKGVDAGATGLVDGRGAVTPRLMVDGGVDLVPGGGPLVVRVEAGVGAGFGLEFRAGASVGVRFGR